MSLRLISKQLEEVFQQLKQVGLKLKPTTHELLQKEVKYLGNVVSLAGIVTDPGKMVASKDWPAPKDMKDL